MLGQSAFAGLHGRYLSYADVLELDRRRSKLRLTFFVYVVGNDAS